MWQRLAASIVLIGLLLPSPHVSAADMTPDTKSWTKISAFWNNGTLPPPHRRSGSLELLANGEGRQVLVKGYQADDANSVAQVFTVDASSLKALTEQLVALKAFSTRWQELSPHPVGGSMRWLQIETTTGTIEVPPFPVGKQRERAEQIFAAVKAIVPKATVETDHESD